MNVRRGHNDMNAYSWDRSGDPLVYFLNEMRSVDLLDAKSEIKLAKTIARGKNYLISVLFSLPFCLATLNKIGEKLRSGEYRVSELVHVKELEDSEGSEEEESYHHKEKENLLSQKYLEQFRLLAERSVQYFDLHSQVVHRRKTKSPTSQGEESLHRLHKSLVKQIQSLKIQQWVIEQVIQEYPEYVSRLAKTAKTPPLEH